MRGPRNTEATERLVRPIVDYIAVLREVAGLSQGELARRAGMDPRNMTRIFNPSSDRRRVDLDTLERLARAVGARLVLDLVPLTSERTLFGLLSLTGRAPQNTGRWRPEVKPVARLIRPIIRGLRRLKDAHGLSLTELAAQTGMDFRNISRVLNTHEGDRHVELESTVRIAAALGCRPVPDLIPVNAQNTALRNLPSVPHPRFHRRNANQPEAIVSG